MRQRNAKGQYVRQTLEERFWEKVERLDGDDACWRWTGQIERTGYGRLTDYWKKFGAHRLSYEINIGPIPEGLHVCHRCDHRWCVRPEHLFVGTARENVEDAITKGRARYPGNIHPQRGSLNGRAKLTEDQVREMRERYRTEAVTYRQLADIYGVSFSLVEKVITRQMWKHVE